MALRGASARRRDTDNAVSGGNNAPCAPLGVFTISTRFEGDGAAAAEAAEATRRTRGRAAASAPVGSARSICKLS